VLDGCVAGDRRAPAIYDPGRDLAFDHSDISRSSNHPILAVSGVLLFYRRAVHARIGKLILYPEYLGIPHEDLMKDAVDVGIIVSAYELICLGLVLDIDNIIVIQAGGLDGLQPGELREAVQR